MIINSNKNGFIKSENISKAATAKEDEKKKKEKTVKDIIGLGAEPIVDLPSKNDVDVFAKGRANQKAVDIAKKAFDVIDNKRDNSTANLIAEHKANSKQLSTKGIIGMENQPSIKLPTDEEYKTIAARHNASNVIERYGINADTFDKTDLDKWADEHNYTRALDGINYVPKRKKGKKQTSGIEENAFQVLSALAENNERKKQSEKDGGLLSNIGINLFDALTLGQGYALSDSKDYKKYTEAGLDKDKFVSNYKAYDKTSKGHWVKKGIDSGIAQFNEGVSATLDFIPTPFSERYDFFHKLHEQNKKDLEAVTGEQSKLTGARKIGSDVVAATVSALPNALLSLFTAAATGGTSAAAQVGNLATTAARNQALFNGSWSVRQSLAELLKQVGKNPAYWTSVMQELGNDYEDAKERGANDGIAAATAVITTALNAGIEVGGGVEQLPSKIVSQGTKQGTKKAVLEWVKSSAEEGSEEVVQSFVTNSLAKMLYDHDAPMVSLFADDDTAVLNPHRSVKNFGMGAAVGGILGGGQTLALNVSNKAAISNVGKFYNDVEIVDAIIETGLDSPKDTLSYKLAERAAEKMKKAGRNIGDSVEPSGKRQKSILSDYEVGLMFNANLEQIQIENAQKEAEEEAAQEKKRKEEAERAKNAKRADSDTAVNNDSAQSNDTNSSELLKKLRNNTETVVNNGEIFNVTEDVISKQDGKKAADKISNYFKSIGGIAHNPTLGDVELNKSGAKSTVFHGVGKEKMQVVPAIKEVIEKGTIISSDTNWKGRGYDTYVIAGAGKLKNKSAIVGVVVKSYPNNNINSKFYVHEIIKIGTGSDTAVNNDATNVNEPVPFDNTTITQNSSVVNTYDTQNSRNNSAASENFIDNRNVVEVGKKSVKAFQYEYPQIKPFYREMAQELKNDINMTVRGEKFVVDNPDVSGQKQWSGTKRNTSNAIAEIKDTFDVSYAQINDALDRIINDNGQENVALAKRIEIVIDDMLTKGYTDIEGRRIEPNAEYIKTKAAIKGTDGSEYSNRYDGWLDDMYSDGADNSGTVVVAHRPDGSPITLPEGADTSVDTLSRTDNKYSAFEGAKRIVFGNDLFVTSNIAVPLNNESVYEIERIAQADRDSGINNEIEFDRSFSLANIYDGSNDVLLSGSPKVYDDAYVFAADGKFYACNQALLDSLVTDDTVILANSNPDEWWNVYEDGKLKAIVPPVAVPNMDNELFDSLKSVSDVTAETEPRFSVSDSFADEYDSWLNRGGNYRTTLTVGRTSQALKSIGVEDKRITWDTAKINKIKNKHSVDDAVIKQVPYILENPVIIMRSVQKDSRLTMCGEVYDLNNHPVMAVIELNPTNAKGEIMLDEIKLVSAYGKDNLQGLINKSDILYVDSNKKRTDDWLTQNRLQLPLGQTNHRYNNSISQNAATVNTDYTQNQQNYDGKTVNNDTDKGDKKRLYDVYRRMKDRCYNKNAKDYKYYGKNGVKLTKDWLNSFETFYNWAVNNGYREGLSIDRIDPNGNYEPNNCRWVTMTVQNRNKRNSVDKTPRFSVSDDSGVAITRDDVKSIQSIPRKSVNDFTSDDISKTENFAKKYFSELGTKSPFFRAWFGDWRANDTTPVRVANRQGSTRGITKNLDTGWDVQISGKVFNETKGHNAPKNKKASPYPDYINSIVENAVLLDSFTVPDVKKKSDNSAMMHSLYAIADMGNGRELIKLYVEELNDVNSDGTIKRAYQLQNINKILLESNRFSNNSLASSDQQNTYTVSQLFDLVKAYDKNFAPHEVSKVVNDDGTPKVMYHGTSNGGFNYFDIYSGNFGLFGQGAYFTENPQIAREYTSKGNGTNKQVYECYLDIKNPMDMDAAADVQKWTQALRQMDEIDVDFTDVKTNEDAFRAVLDELMYNDYRSSEAYDFVESLMTEYMQLDGLTHVGGGRRKGADVSHRVWIAFYPNQIKSVTDNIGTFDSGNDDIRFSVSDVNEHDPFTAPQSAVDKLSSQIDSWLAGEYKSNETFDFGNTPVVLRRLGAQNLPVVMTQDTMVKITGGKHSIPLDTIRSLVQGITDPIMVFKSATVKNAYVILTELSDNLGRPIIAAMHLNKVDNRLRINRIASIYGRNNAAKFVKSQFKSGNVKYVDEIKSQGWSTSRGLQLPKLVQSNPDNNIILYKEDIVNSKYTQDSDNYDGNFDMDTSVEYTKDLVAVHNLSADKLEKTLDLGGFPMPSIAVTKDTVSHDNFGDISVVFDKNTIDPESNPKNKVYSADVWSPVFPNIEYEANDTVVDRIHDKYYELSRKYGHDVAKPLSKYADSSNAEEYLGSAKGEENLIDNIKNDTKMMQTFLYDVGMGEVEPIKVRSVERLDDSTVQMYDFIVDKLGKKTFAELRHLPGESIMSSKRTWLANNGDNLTAAMTEYFGEKLNLSQAEAEDILSHETNSSKLNLATDIRNYLANGAENVTEVVDNDATNKRIKTLADNNGYDEWVDTLFTGIEKSQGISNGKDPYTASGNRRTFSQLHYSVTLENIVKAMQSQGGDMRNVSGFVGTKSLRASLAKSFESVSDMHKNEGKIQNLSGEQFNTIAKDLDEKLADIIDKIYNSKPHGQYDNIFSEYNIIGEDIVEACSLKTKTPQSVKEMFAKYGYNISSDIASEVVGIMNEAAQMPVNLFEAKPERVVGFDEIRFVAMPQGKYNGLKEQLLQLGIDVKEYNPDVSGSRLEVINSDPTVKFSVADNSYKYAKQLHDALNGKMRQGYHVYIGKTPNLLIKAGLDDGVMLMTQGHLRDINHEKVRGINKYHGISEQILVQLPELLKKPVMIYDSVSADNKSGTICVVTNKVDGDGLPVIVAITPLNRAAKYYDVSMQPVSTTEGNISKSLYGKDNFLRHLDEIIGQNAVIYANKSGMEKLINKINPRSNADGELQLLKRLGDLGYDKIIHQSNNLVNSNYMPNNEIYSNNTKGVNQNEQNQRNDILSGDGRRSGYESAGEQNTRVQKTQRENQTGNETQRRTIAEQLRQNGYTSRLIDARSRFDVIDDAHLTDDMRAVKAENSRRGLNTYFFVGRGEYAFDTANAVNIDGCINGNNVYLRYDGTYTPEQLNKHELVHKDYNTDEVVALREEILGSLSEDEKQDILSLPRYRHYLDVYGGNENLVWEEFVADTLAGMNNYSAEFESRSSAYWNAEQTANQGYSPSTFAESIDTGKSVSDSPVRRLSAEQDAPQTLRLPPKEYALVSRAVMAKNAGLTDAELKPVDYVFAADEFYYYKNNSLGDFSVIDKLDPATEISLIENVKESIDNGTYAEPEGLVGLLDSVQIRRRGDNRNNVRSEDGRTAESNDRFPTGQQRSNSVRYTSEVREDKSGEVKLSVSTDGQHDLLAAYDDAKRKYGTFNQGENPVRVVSVPRQIDDDRHVNRFARTMMESEVTPDNNISDFEKDIMDGKMAHEVITDKKAAKDAVDKIKKEGFEGAMNSWDVFVRSDKVGKKDFALGLELYNQCITNKDTQRAMKLAAELSAISTAAGQTVQAARMLKKMSPSGQLYYLTVSVDQINNEFKNKLGDKFKDVVIDEEIMKRYLDAPNETERTKIYDELCQNIADQIPATKLEKWNAWRYLAMLGNPRTHIRNIVGNAVFLPAQRLSNYVGAVIEKAMNVDESERRYSASKSKKAVDFAKADFEKMQKRLQGVNDKYAVTSDIGEKRRIFNNNILETVRKKNFDFLEKEDMVFLKVHYVDALARIITAQNIDVNNIDAETLESIRQHAVKVAKAATYRDDNALAEFITSAQRRAERSDNRLLRATAVGMESVMPFKKTPLNIAKQGVIYSPVGLMNGVYKLLRNLHDGSASTADVVDSLSKGLVGTALTMLGLFLASKGLLRGGDDEQKKKRDFDTLLGKQSFSFVFGDNSYTIDWMVPSALPLFVGCELFNLTKDEFKVRDVAEALSKLSSPLLELSVFSGISDLISSAQYRGTEALTAVTTDMAMSYVLQVFPTLGGQFARIVDGSRREYYYNNKQSQLPKGLQQLFGRIAAKIPFAGMLIGYEKSVDDWGRDKTYGSLPERIFENTVSPGYYSKYNYTEVDRELERLYEATGETEVLPRSQGKTVVSDKVAYDLTPEEYAKVKRLRGQKSYELIKELISSTKYKNMSDDDRVKAIKKCYDNAYKYAKEQTLDAIKNKRN